MLDLPLGGMKDKWKNKIYKYYVKNGRTKNDLNLK